MRLLHILTFSKKKKKKSLPKTTLTGASLTEHRSLCPTFLLRPPPSPLVQPWSPAHSLTHQILNSNFKIFLFSLIPFVFSYTRHSLSSPPPLCPLSISSVPTTDSGKVAEYYLSITRELLSFLISGSTPNLIFLSFTCLLFSLFCSCNNGR